MHLLFGLFIILGVFIQVGRLIEWVLKGLGFFKTPLQQALCNVGYSKDSFWEHVSDSSDFRKTLRAELENRRSSLYGNYSRSAEFNKSSIDMSLDTIDRYDRQYQIDEAIKQYKAVCGDFSVADREMIWNKYHVAV